MKRNGSLILLLLLCFTQVAFAQNKTVKGEVISSIDNLPIIDAFVVVVGNQSIGTLTDANGQFSLSVPETATQVQVSYLGHETKIVDILDSYMKIILNENSNELQNAVVTGYSTASKRNFVGSATTINSKEILSKSVSSVSTALSGESAGVNVINTSGQPGTLATINIRGIGSVNGSSAPLYIVDGVPYSGAVSAISAGDIENISILKDASSTAIYGARGANGVIVITTKKGSRDKVRINAEQVVGINVRQLPRYELISNPEEYISLMWQGLKQKAIDLGEKNPVKYANENLFVKEGIEATGIKEAYNIWNASPSELIDPETGRVRQGISRKYTPENWSDYAFQPSRKSETIVSLSGGDNNTQYYVSLNYLNEKGYALKSSLERFSARANIISSPVKWLKAGLNINYATTKTVAGGQGGNSSVNMFYFVDNIPPIYPLFLRDRFGNKIEDNIYGGYVYDFGKEYGRSYQPLSNAVGSTVLDQSYSNWTQLILIGTLDFRLAKGLTFENKIQHSKMFDNIVSLSNKYYGQAATSGGSLTRNFNGGVFLSDLNLLRYKKLVGLHSIEAFAAHELTVSDDEYNSVYKNKLVFPNDIDLDNALETQNPASGSRDQLRLQSYFGQVNYVYADKYFVSGTIRRDGSSRFENNKWGNFYSLGLAWMMSDEDFMKSVEWLKELKLKASFGTLGSQEGISYYSGKNLYSLSNVNGNPSFLLTFKGNPDLTWEKSSMFQLGTEFNIADRVEGSIEFYNKITSDMIYNLPQAISTGIRVKQVNDGKLLNRGVDFDFNFRAYRDRDAFLNVRLNGAYNLNRILRMPVDPATGKPKIISGNESVGHSLYDHYMRKFVGVNPESGEEEYEFIFADNNANGTYEADTDAKITSYVLDLQEHPEYKDKLVTSKTTNSSIATFNYRGTALPFLKGGITLDGGWKGINVRAQFIYSLGGRGYDAAYAEYMNSGNESGLGDKNFHVDILKRWTTAGQHSDVAKFSAGYRKNSEDIPEIERVSRAGSDKYLVSASFFQVGNIKIGYTLPENIVNKLRLSNVELWLSGDNLWVFSARKGYNPSIDIAGGSAQGIYQPLTSYTAGIRLNF